MQWWDGSCRGGMGHAGMGGSSMGGVGHVQVVLVMWGWDGSCRGGMGHAGVGGSSRGGVDHVGVGWAVSNRGGMVSHLSDK